MIELFIKGGFLMYPITLCSFAGVAIFINKYIQYRRIIRELTGNTNKESEFMKELIELAKSKADEKMLSIVGTKKMKEVEKGLSWLSLISTITPLLGLTGTVTGMIKAFMVIAESTSVSPSMLAGGIWEALITTAGGLLVAIPIHIGHHYLEKQADDIAFLMKEVTLELLKRS
ncbi:MAG: MotA/TolQ/ExbB proton channel family protein [bacterium]